MARNTGPTPAQRRAVIERDGGRCVCCGKQVADPDTGEPWLQYSLQHRQARGMGGTKRAEVNDWSNLIVMCGTGTTGCHGKAEHDPRWAAAMGYRVSSWEDPAEVPVHHVTLGVAMITSAGWEPQTQQWPCSKNPHGHVHLDGPCRCFIGGPAPSFA